MIECNIQIEAGVLYFQSKLRVKIFLMASVKITCHKRHDIPRVKPSEERFKSNVGKIIVRPDFMSEEWRVKLLQKDPKNHSCRVWGTMEETMEELAPTPLACAIFEANCSYLQDNGENASKLTVFSKKKTSVLSSLKVGLRFAFLPSPETASCLRVPAHVFFI